jgi:redox-sensitive bicupin YhaK (pirin superfamily)
VLRARAVERLVTGQATQDGAGVRLTRLLTPDLQRRLDPFLMLDAFGSDRPSDYIGGFPDHPHRGFETVTLMMEGRMRHRDSAGNEGLLVPGSVQWMTAGRGVIHSEMPEQEDGRMEGFQLWLNLPARDKMCAPWYRDIPSAEIPEVQAEGVKVRVIAGQALGVQGAMQRDATAPTYLDLHLAPSARFDQALPPAHIIVCGWDPLHDEGIAYGAKLRSLGVQASEREYASMVHGFLNLTPFSVTARTAAREAGEITGRALGAL